MAQAGTARAGHVGWTTVAWIEGPRPAGQGLSCATPRCRSRPWGSEQRGSDQKKREAPAVAGELIFGSQTRSWSHCPDRLSVSIARSQRYGATLATGAIQPLLLSGLLRGSILRRLLRGSLLRSFRHGAFLLSAPEFTHPQNRSQRFFAEAPHITLCNWYRVASRTSAPCQVLAARIRRYLSQDDLW